MQFYIFRDILSPLYLFLQDLFTIISNIFYEFHKKETSQHKLKCPSYDYTLPLFHFFSINIFLLIKLYTMTTAVAPIFEIM